MRRLISVFLALTVLLSSSAVVLAADGSVTYDGNAKKVIFAPGNDYSPTDLFPEFKDVMPGDSLLQKITVKNAASNNVKVKIYIRALGAHEDSVSFLSQLALRVKLSDDNEMAYMFDAHANETAQLTDWVCLGVLYSGGMVNLDVFLDVPVELDNKFQQQIGYLDWEFRIEEFPVEEGDPQPPQTGDNFDPTIWIVTMLVSFGGILVILLFLAAKRKKEEE